MSLRFVISRAFACAIISRAAVATLLLAAVMLMPGPLAFAHSGGGGGSHGGGGASRGSYGGRSYAGGFGAAYSGHATSSIYHAGYAGAANSHSGYPGHAGAEWNNGGNWAHHDGGWYGWNRYPWGGSFYGGGWGGWWPGWGFDFGFYPGLWYPGYAGYWPAYYTAYSPYCYDYSGNTGFGYADLTVGQGYETAYRGVPEAAPVAGEPNIGQIHATAPALPSGVHETASPVTGEANNRRSAEALQYYSEARGAFTKGDFRDAQRLASHAAVEAPQNPKVHEMISLSLFATGDYLDAARAAHLALVLDPPGDWNNLYSYYGDVDKYTSQLRLLEKTVHDAPEGAAGHFLLGYHYLMTGATDNAKREFQAAAKLTPGDKLAAHIVKQLDAGQPVKPPTLPKPPTPAPAADEPKPQAEGQGQSF